MTDVSSTLAVIAARRGAAQAFQSEWANRALPSDPALAALVQLGRRVAGAVLRLCDRDEATLRRHEPEPGPDGPFCQRCISTRPYLPGVPITMDWPCADVCAVIDYWKAEP